MLITVSGSVYPQKPAFGLRMSPKVENILAEWSKRSDVRFRQTAWEWNRGCPSPSPSHTRLAAPTPWKPKKRLWRTKFFSDFTKRPENGTGGAPHPPPPDGIPQLAMQTLLLPFFSPHYLKGSSSITFETIFSEERTRGLLYLPTSAVARTCRLSLVGPKKKIWK